MALKVNVPCATAGAPATLVLMYHRVAEPRHDPFGLCVTPENFAEHMRVVREIAQPIELGSCRRPAAGGRPRVAVTFDDGYLDNLTNAVPVLEAEEVPATVFIVSEGIGQRTEFWWDQLEQCFRGTWTGSRHLDVESGDLRAAGDIECDEESMRALHGFLLQLAPQAIAEVLAEVRRQLGLPDPAFERRTVDQEQLAALASSPAISIGAHTRRHPNLVVLSPDQRHDEILGSKRALEGLLDRRVEHFTYPYGSIDQGTVSCAQQAGFTAACTVSPGRVQPGTHPLMVPRCNVENWDGGAFERQLTSWLSSN